MHSLIILLRSPLTFPCLFLVGKWQFAALFELVLLAPMLYPTAPDAEPEGDKPAGKKAAGRKRKRGEKDNVEVIPCQLPTTAVEWERVLALQVLRKASQEVGYPLSSLCAMRWRSPAQHEWLELPVLSNPFTVTATDISALNKICHTNQRELLKWVKAVQVDIASTV